MKKIILTLTCVTIISNVGNFNIANAHYHDNYGHHNINTQMQVDKFNFDPLINNEIVDSMHMPMMNEEFVQSGNVDKDFIANMIPHHQGAIDSAKLILEYGSNEEVKAIARNIIKTQTKEIEAFNKLLDTEDFDDSNLSKKAYAEFVAKEKENMAEMMNKMIAVTRTRDKKTADYTFILAMKYHHEGAIKASKQILAYTKNPQIRKIAKNIIKDQAKEIKQFDKLIEQGL